MQAIILAAGKGTRLGSITQDIPKPLMEIKPGITILDETLSRLPEDIKDVIIVVNHLGDQIKKRYVDSAFGKNISYAFHEKLDGTAKAVWAAQNLIRDHFLVLMGDDIYETRDLKNLLNNDWAVLVQERQGKPTGGVVHAPEGHLVSIIDYPEESMSSFLLNTGACKLTKDFFNYAPLPVREGADEYGLPQTIASAANDRPIKIEYATGFLQVNNQDNLNEARRFFGWNETI